MHPDVLILSKECGQLCHLEGIALATSRGVDEHDLFITVTCERMFQLIRSEDDIYRQTDNFGVTTQVLA